MLCRIQYHFAIPIAPASLLKIALHTKISEIPAEAWNRLVKNNHPFLRHEFLHAMEKHGCVGEKYGWLPRHISLFDGDELVGAVPLYEKQNSYGEFVFDFSWADAYERAGLKYYPKLVSAIPYTPATGERMLCASGREAEVYPLLLKTVLQLAEQIDASSVHVLFPAEADQEYLQHQNLLVRHDCQFHWHNRGYSSFDDFLERLISRKRKRIRRERRMAAESGVTFRLLDGHTANDKDWQDFTRFYNRTFAEKWGVATFNLPFFKEIASQIPQQIVLVLVDLDGECIAGALMYRSDTTLYGRHWGCTEQIDGVHFEACYYQGIEYCIKHGLQRFEPGAQGEHKIARGFVPVLTRSSHWIASDAFREPIAAFVQHERAAVSEYIEEQSKSIPYKGVG